jgi:transposase
VGMKQSAPKKKEALADLRSWLADALAEGRTDEAIEAVVAMAGQLMDRATEAEWRLAMERRAASGRRTEKLDASQLSMMLALAGADAGADLEPIEDAEDVSEDDTGTRPPPADDVPARRPRRRKLPEHLPREEMRYELPAAELACGTCHGTLAHIGDDTSETLELIPARFRVKKHVVAKYACSRCKDGVTTAPGPAKPVAGGFAEPGLLAHIVCSKYLDHIPLQRLRGVYRRGGVDIPVSTLCDQVGAVADLVEPLVRRITERMHASFLIQTDASGLKVLDRDHPDGIRKGTMWAYVGDRRWMLFEYARTGEAKDGPWARLAGREGYVQADADAKFDRLYNGRVAHAVEVGCWAHARRRFFKLKDSEPAVAWPLQLIGKLYRIEKDATARGLDASARQKLRGDRASKILDQLKRWLVRTAAKEPPQSALHKACAYSITHWTALIRYLDDGRLGPDNNLCELQIRSLAIGRKNYLFAGSDVGAERAAINYSLLRTCALHRVEPYAYLTDVLTKLAAGWPQSRIDELLPDAWAASHPEDVLPVDEREARDTDAEVA